MKMARLLEIAVCVILTCIQSGETTSYNSSTACLRGSQLSYVYSATCDRNTTSEVGIIAVNRVFYGAQPDSSLCQTTDPASVCCSYTPDQDCFFANKPGQLPLDVVKGCSGNQECQVPAEKKFTGSTCDDPTQFLQSSFNTYGFMEYECINVALLTDICHTGIIKEDDELYINSNIYHVNTEHSDKSCTCKVTTSCGAAIIFEAVDIRLETVPGTDICVEELYLVDNEDSNSTKTVTCSNTNLNALTEVFTSQSNSVTLNLTISGNHVGKLWMKMKASWLNATVRIQCGATYSLDTPIKHQCREDVTPVLSTATLPSTATTSTTTATSPTTTATTPTTPFSTTTTTPTTTHTTIVTTTEEEDECGPEECGLGTGDINELPTGAIAGIIVAGVLILLVIIFILVLVFRRHRQADHTYDTPNMATPSPVYIPEYESLQYQPQQQKPPPDVHAYDNPAYGHGKTNLGGASYDYQDMATSLPNDDNEMNDSIMVMPKGAVM